MKDSKRSAVAIIGFNRPEYFRRSLHGILTNAPIVDCDLWVFLDGGDVSLQRLHTMIVMDELSKAPFEPKDLRLVWRCENLDCGRNIIDARHQLFDVQRYDEVFVFEDDMVPSPHYMSVCQRMLEWSRCCFSDIGVVQAYNSCWLSEREKAAQLDLVRSVNSNWWGYLMPREMWDAIRSILLEYDASYLRGKRYAERDIGKLHQWVCKLIRDYEGRLAVTGFAAENSYPETWDFRKYFREDFSLGQDAFTALAVALAGKQKLSPVVNRSLPIGRKGIHSTSATFARSKLDRMELHHFESDAYPRSFLPWTEHRDHVCLVPYMRTDEVEAIRRLLRERKIRRVLEIGAGGSTITFAREPAIELWWSVEWNRTWIDRVLLALTPFDAQRVRLVHSDKRESIECVARILDTQSFDLYFVDGGDRPQLLRLLHKHLQDKRGVVLLHDFSRVEYADAVSQFSRCERISVPGVDSQGLVVLEV